jgi:2-phosphosulfolactate phosphatase
MGLAGAGALPCILKPHFGQASCEADCNSARLKVCVQTGFGQGIVFAMECIIRRRFENARGERRTMLFCMPAKDVLVYLTPQLVDPFRLKDGVAVVIDVLRATTTIVYALGAGCSSVRPCAEIDEAKALASTLPKRTALLAGERDGKPIPGFDLGNSPREFTARKCKDKTLILTTTNGTHAVLRAINAQRVLIAGFVNFSAVCEQLQAEACPVHIVCAGYYGEPCLEDTLLAGAFVEFFSEETDIRPNDSARLAWDCFENHGRILGAALECSNGGEHLKSIGYEDDIKLAAEIDKFAIVPELRRDPLRIEVTSAGIVKQHWVK